MGMDGPDDPAPERLRRVEFWVSFPVAAGDDVGSLLRAARSWLDATVFTVRIARSRLTPAGVVRVELLVATEERFRASTAAVLSGFVAAVVTVGEPET